MQTDWLLVNFQSVWSLTQLLIGILCTVGLGWFVNHKMERLKTALLLQQAVRNEKKEAYCQALKVLGEMRYAVGIAQVDPSSVTAGSAYSRLEDLRQELYRIAPCVIMVLNGPTAAAFEAYRRIAEPALQLDPVDYQE